jgi:Plasmid pRiA4b ORF-3-like protein
LQNSFLKLNFTFDVSTKTKIMVYKFRVILDAEEDIFRDIAILSDDTLEDLHNAIFNAFGFDGMEVASFYTCDETWNQEDEIPLFDTGDVPGEQRTMSDYALSDILDEANTKIIYVYDFINMWTFLVELAAIEEPVAGGTYPETLFSHGIMPAEAGEKNFEADMNDDIYGEFEDDLDEDDLDMFSGDDSFEDYGFEENWN